MAHTFFLLNVFALVPKEKFIMGCVVCIKEEKREST
jgi:hypothetical protein